MRDRTAGALFFALVLAGPTWAAEPPGLGIGTYEKVGERVLLPFLTEHTYRATLANDGPALASATAETRAWAFRALVIDRTLAFGPVGANASVASTDTFSFWQLDFLPFDVARLNWTIVPVAANQPPVADAGDDFTRRVGETAALDGSRSSDPDGDPLTYAWTLTSVPPGSAAALSDVTAAGPTFLVDRPGTYVAQLVVGDGAADSAADTVTITTENTPPSARAGPDQTAPVGTLVTLDGSASNDVDGDGLTYTWTFDLRPPGSAATLSDPTAVSPAFVVDAPGTYVARLVVHDGHAESAPDTITVSTSNSPPVANAGADQTARVGWTVILDGSGSSDVDGDPLDFAWSFVSRPAGSTAALDDETAVSPRFVVDVPGTYAVQLVAGDAGADSAPDVVLVTTENSPPVANAGPDQAVYTFDTVTLDGAGSTDVDGDALTYTWSLTSVPPGSLAALDDPALPRPAFVADLPGVYVAQLVVHDGEAMSAPDTVSVRTENSPPVAEAGPDQAAVAGQQVELDGTGSSDVDGDPLSYLWAITTRPAASDAALDDPSSPTPSFTADEPGTYVVQLIVSDGTIGSAPDTVTVTTTANAVPVADAGPDQTDVLVGATVVLDGSGSSDADGHPLTFQWSLLARPAGSAAALSAAGVERPIFVADVAGDYVAQLMVSDGFLTSAPDTVTVTARVPLPSVSIVATDPSASEAPFDAGTFTITRHGPAADALTIRYTVGGTAANALDYLAIASEVTLAAGATATTVIVEPVEDSEVEGPETVVLILLPDPAYALGALDAATVNILDDERPVVTVTSNDDAAEVGPDPGTFTIARTGPTDAALTVTYALAGSAVNGTDYELVATEVTIPAGAASATVTITPIADGLVEGTESVVLGLSPGSAYVLAVPAIAVLTITDALVVTVTATDADASEVGLEPGAFTFTRAGDDLAEPLTLFVTASGTASSTDYTGLWILVTIPAGAESVTVVVTPRADNLVEGPETLTATIGPSSAYTVGTPGAATLTIADDPAVVAIAATDPDASELGLATGTFTLTRNGGNLAASLAVRVTLGGAATNASDYAFTSGLITIPAGQASATVTITPLADNRVEGPEPVVFTVEPQLSYLVGTPAAATVTIADDPPVVSVIASDPDASEAGPDAGEFTLSRTGGDLSAALSVFASRGGTAIRNTDYTGLAGGALMLLTIPAGQPSLALAITPVVDAIVEGDETVIVDIEPGSSYVIGAPNSATVTIADGP